MATTSSSIPRRAREKPQNLCRDPRIVVSVQDRDDPQAEKRLVVRMSVCRIGDLGPEIQPWSKRFGVPVSRAWRIGGSRSGP